MKKIIIAFFPWFFLCFGYKAMAQQEQDKKEDKKETEEIVIRKKGSKDATINVQINGDQVLINGKPLSEFNDDNITVNKRKMTVRRGDDRTMIFSDGDMDIDMPPMTWSNSDGDHGAFLGVSTVKTEEGAKITTVNKESAAAKAGLQNGDIIIKLEDKKIDGPQSLYEAVNAKKATDEVKITFKRDGKEKTTKAVLGERKSSFSKSYSYSSPDGSYKTFTMPMEHMKELQELQQLNDIQGMQDYGNFGYSFPGHKKLGLKIQDTEEGNGVKVLEVEDSSAAALAGLKKDDIITEVGGEKVKNTDEAREQLQENREKGSYAIKARRNGTEMNFTIKIPKKLKTTNL
jgi:serine protease Do